MRGWWVVFLVFFAAAADSQVFGEGNVIVSDNGDALVLLDLFGNGTVNVPTPLDVESPKVRGALYVSASNGIDVSFDGEATVAYMTQLLTSKDGDVWSFWAELPEIPIGVTVSFPANARVISTEPTAFVEQGDDSVNVMWISISSENISADYKLSFDEPVTAAAQPDRGGVNPFLYAAALFAFIFIYLYMSRRKSGIVLSKGKRNVMKTLTGNEYKIVTLLLESREGLKRSELERKSGIAKSSLASALYNLEQKNILGVDKTEEMHYVELTEWFKSL
ncbi:MAG: hypothetical protein V1921_05480 [Candidatus Altiarchaeota archaeon]